MVNPVLGQNRFCCSALFNVEAIICAKRREQQSVVTLCCSRGEFRQ